jgi:hypothetical protein
MSKKYTGTLRSVYRLPRRFIVAHGMRIEFINGVANGIPEYQANLLMKNNVLASMFEEGVVPEEGIHSDSSQIEIPEINVVQFDETESIEESFGEVESSEWSEYIPEDSSIEQQSTQGVFEEAEQYGSVVSNEGESDNYENIESEIGSVTVMTTLGEITREDMQGLYAELKTWAAVASHFEVSTTVLKRYRDELGL